MITESKFASTSLKKKAKITEKAIQSFKGHISFCKTIGEKIVGFFCGLREKVYFCVIKPLFNTKNQKS